MPRKKKSKTKRTPARSPRRRTSPFEDYYLINKQSPDYNIISSRLDKSQKVKRRDYIFSDVYDDEFINKTEEEKYNYKFSNIRQDYTLYETVPLEKVKPPPKTLRSPCYMRRQSPETGDYECIKCPTDFKDSEYDF